MTDLDGSRLDEFEGALLAGTAVRVGRQQIWRALAKVFPHRTPGPAERRLLLRALIATEERGSIRLPPERGRRWDRSIEPAVPTSVDVVRAPPEAPPSSWRTFPWHRDLQWVATCRGLSAQQIEFLRRVHDGLVNGAFREPAPLKYRSLQLTGDEKLLASFAKTSLFGESRLSLDMLACQPDALPMAWEVVGDGGRMIIFENADPFAVARRVLGELKDPPYGLIGYGGGRGIVSALGHLVSIEPVITAIHYVGDLDHVGLEIARSARVRAEELGLPRLSPAAELHRQMLRAAEAFGHPQGWPSHASRSERADCLESLSADLRDAVDDILRAGHRVPEEVLGPDELRSVWAKEPR